MGAARRQAQGAALSGVRAWQRVLAFLDAASACYRRRMLKGRRAQAILAWLLGAYLATVLRTIRWKLVGEANVAPCFKDQAAVVAFWHERLSLMPQLWLEARRRGAPMNLHVLVSRHRDGRLIGRLMQRFGVGLVHGSSSRGGAASLRTCIALLQAGDHIVITPDGPRGPRRVAAAGVAQLAAMAGVPVLPTAAQTTRRVTLDSWDRMVLPLPFGRGIIVCGAPIAVDQTDWASSLPRIAAALDAAADEADRLCHVRT
jgi:lysophospholipid acyltransferase (LPLAT)-like uncharacterized protein